MEPLEPPGGGPQDALRPPPVIGTGGHETPLASPNESPEPRGMTQGHLGAAWAPSGQEICAEAGLSPPEGGETDHRELRGRHGMTNGAIKKKTTQPPAARGLGLEALGGLTT